VSNDARQMMSMFSMQLFKAIQSVSHWWMSGDVGLGLRFSKKKRKEEKEKKGGGERTDILSRSFTGGVTAEVGRSPSRRPREKRTALWLLTRFSPRGRSPMSASQSAVLMYKSSRDVQVFNKKKNGTKERARGLPHVRAV